jgi:hypothetical protein
MLMTTLEALFFLSSSCLAIASHCGPEAGCAAEKDSATLLQSQVKISAIQSVSSPSLEKDAGAEKKMMHAKSIVHHDPTTGVQTALGIQVHAPYRDLGDLCSKHPEMAKYSFLAVVSQFDGNVSWADDLTFPHIIYLKGDDTNDFVALNRGTSETNRVKFFAQFYNCLPKFTIVLHQDNFRYLPGSDTVAVLNDPFFQSKVQQHKGYWNFNTCHTLGTILNENGQAMQKSGWWSATMEPWFGRFEDHGDFTSGHPCCAQFVVSREHIQSRPREFYQNMYSWYATKSDNDCPSRNSAGGPNSCYMTARYLEWTWHLIFSKNVSADH